MIYMEISLPSKISIVQIGCGGTGGYLVPKLARLLMTLAEFKKELQFCYTLVDFDLVEEANLYRQNFISNDLGKNKADVMAIRYGSHFEIDIRSSNQKIDKAKNLKTLFALSQNDGVYWSPSCLCILIGCVDNNNARKVMHELFQTWDGFGYGYPLVYLDSGNGKFNGQIVVGYRTAYNIISPSVGSVFPEALEEDTEENPVNCTLNALENPQNIGANDLASTLLFSVLNILLTDEELNSHIIGFDGKTQEVWTKNV